MLKHCPCCAVRWYKKRTICIPSGRTTTNQCLMTNFTARRVMESRFPCLGRD
jgi:hypothetical protein